MVASKAILEDKEKLKQLLKKHENNAVQVAKAIDVSQPTVSFWILAHGLNDGSRWPKGWSRLLGFKDRGTLQRRLQKKSIPAVAKDLGIQSRTLYAFVHRYQLYPTQSRLRLRDIDKKDMRYLISNSRGVSEEICRVTGTGWQSVKRKIEQLGLSSHLEKVQKESSLIVALAGRYGSGKVPALPMPGLDDRARFVLSTLREFLTLEEIGKIFGVTSSRVHQVQKQLE